jgi:hypothetical protein
MQSIKEWNESMKKVEEYRKEHTRNRGKILTYIEMSCGITLQIERRSDKFIQQHISECGCYEKCRSPHLERVVRKIISDFHGEMIQDQDGWLRVENRHNPFRELCGDGI